MSPNLRGGLLALAAFFLFSAHDVVVKHLGATYAPVQILFFSVLFSFPLATMMAVGDRADANLRPRHPAWMALRMAAVAVTGLSAFYAFSNLPLAQVYAILFATPLFITVLSIPVLGEVVRARRWAAVFVGLGGVSSSCCAPGPLRSRPGTSPPWRQPRARRSRRSSRARSGATSGRS